MFLAWVVLVKVIFPRLNLKPDDGFLPFHMHEVFNKTGHCFTDIIIILSWCFTILGITVHVSTVC